MVFFVIRRHSVPAFRQVLRANARLRQMESQNDNIFLGDIIRCMNKKSPCS